LHVAGENCGQRRIAAIHEATRSAVAWSFLQPRNQYA
jgi:hypothetical protein